MGLGLTSSSGGEDSLQVRIAVVCIVISLMVTALTPYLMPEWDAESGDLLDETRKKMESFTGESMVSMSPWVLTSVRTPYTTDAQLNEKSDYGWVYGSISYTYTLDGVTYCQEAVDEDGDGLNEPDKDKAQSVIKMDPTKQSLTTLSVTTADWYGTEYDEYDDIWDEIEFKLFRSLDYIYYYTVGQLVDAEDPYDKFRSDTDTWSLNAFNFTGQLYHFDPLYRISTQDSTDTNLNSDVASLNVVWYNNSLSSGISSGLVLYSERDHAVIQNFASDSIIDSANTSTGEYASKFTLNFNGTIVYMYIMFDTEVLTNSIPLKTAWDNGMWTISFASPSADGLLDIFNSNDLSSSMGNLLETYIAIFTFDMPNLPTGWSIVLWVLCVLPLEIVMILFLSRFGIAGLGMGVLGSALAFIGLS